MYSLAHMNWTRKDDCVLVTNDLGRFRFLSNEDFDALIHGTLSEESELFAALEEAGFIFRDVERYIADHVDEMACMKQCLLIGTQLLILVLTDACNQRCVYCQAGEEHTKLTSIEVCKKAIDMAVQSPVMRMTIEFQGGEPTLNTKALYFSIPYAKKVFAEKGKDVDFAIVTNLTECDPELIRWLIAEDVHISTSLDGPQRLHEINRPLASKRSSYEAWQRGVSVYRSLCEAQGKLLRVGAIQTTTRESLKYADEIVSEYINNGIDHLYIRPLTPLGRAKEKWDFIGYTANEYIQFYKKVVDNLLNRCRNGEMVYEATASIYLARILNNSSVGHTEFRSPCGAATSQMAVNYDGKVYTCDEGRMVANMGDDIFCLGSVDNTYQELIKSPAAHAVCTASCVESLPFCTDCVYSPYCAACPVVNYGIEGDLVSHDEDSYRCQIARGIMDYLFGVIQSADEETMEILRIWAND